MTTTIVCTDGSDTALHAAKVGVALLTPSDQLLVVAVAEGLDPSLTYDGSGHAGPSMTPAQYDAHRTSTLDAAHQAVERTADALGPDVSGVETIVIEGDAGPALCALADDRSARALLIGSRGRGGIKRALLGSVSDYVVRNASCPVIVTSE
ncbi:MAG TPA: universal stress protein [Acidimicrobiia bacterium]|jgi:nucleotide-binding universal stress UspA family protein